MGEAFARVVGACRYTIWGSAILRNHAHLCVRKHGDTPETIWRTFAEESTTTLRRFAEVPDNHPIWSSRPYKVFLYTPDDVRRVVKYIQDNPAKEKLAPQQWNFVKSYEGWPHTRGQGG